MAESNEKLEVYAKKIVNEIINTNLKQIRASIRRQCAEKAAKWIYVNTHLVEPGEFETSKLLKELKEEIENENGYVL